MSRPDDIFRGYGVEVKLRPSQPKHPGRSPLDASFLKIRETLTRIGDLDEPQGKLFQSCHILHKRGRYVIVHYKEMWGFDGHPVSPTAADVAVRNSVASLLEQWNLVTVLDVDEAKMPRAKASEFTVLQHGEKADWALVQRYSIGARGVV